MSSSTPTVLPFIEWDSSVKQELLSSVEETGPVVVHGTITCTAWWELVRIWKTTYLIDPESAHQSSLLQAYNISLAPNWTPLIQGQTLRFTLIFEALPKSCRSFDFMEIIPEPGGFLVEGIPRNQTDIYRIDLSNPGL
ncbi:MAG: hypothetical protein A1D16_07265 [Flavihumibacter sp. CACIAM 22H1]|nr:MAG: hypothetical protein A1D16_07265 [Flavihumibacter sp. CACIAM 22H1]